MPNEKPAGNIFIRTLLRSPGLRRRLGFALAHDHFADLQLCLPIREGLAIPLDHEDAIDAFTETFFGYEYGNLLERIPPPARWLDIGSHRAMFTLWMVWEKSRRRLPPGEALLIDADPRAEKWFNALRARNGQLQAGFQFLLGAVAAEKAGEQIPFAQRSGMGSLHPEHMPMHYTSDQVISVPRLKVADIGARFAPPYDLIKVDIEGAEFALFETAGEVLRQGRALTVEWHDWDDCANQAETRLAKAAATLGFGPPEILRTARSVPMGHITSVTGTHLYRNLHLR